MLVIFINKFLLIPYFPLYSHMSIPVYGKLQSLCWDNLHVTLQESLLLLYYVLFILFVD